MHKLKKSPLKLSGLATKTERINVNLLKKRLEFLKQDFLRNEKEIFDCERRLTGIHDKNLSSKVSCFKIFENLNNERMTPAYLSLVKNRSDAKLSQIKKDDGTNFMSDEARHKHIFDTYEKLYENKDAGIAMPENVIEEFLGPDIVNSEIVRNSILTEYESSWLDRPLSQAELDISVKKGKLRSAPGSDGFSNFLIQKIWPYIRVPFLNYANHCFDTGTLTQNFCSATIRLIPKKGYLTLLKNWRPISLLSNFYKILSRAINLRLNKFVNRICSRSQKGYNSCRYSQEVLINIWEQIAHCKLNNIKGAIVAIDMAKAFDTLSHAFLDKVHKFFNLGPVIRRWLALLGNDRQACISLEGKKSTKYFKLGRGRPQGDNISPNTFNFAVQILIFKIELDPIIKKIPRESPHINNLQNTFFSKECNRDTEKKRIFSGRQHYRDNSGRSLADADPG
jgi:hypothetical protein